MDIDTVPLAQAGNDGMPTRSPSIRIAIVEDMQSYADMLWGLCHRDWGMDVVLIAHTGLQAYEAMVRIKPDVILLDLGLPDIDGVVLAKWFNLAVPTARIVVVSGSCCDYQLHRLGRVRLHGYFDKFADDLPRLRQAIELASRGESYFSPLYLNNRRRLRRSATAFFKVLSEREQEILGWIAHAQSDEEIGVQLGISVTTVQTHRREVMRKLNIHSTPKLVRYGMELGLCAVPSLHPFLEQL